ncbi:hypothetical protein SNE40_022178 [Patella caerulea]|uniref:QRICH1-like domain-containing protein n=1 Tax=Patella caerulea TaxID=87958 RepID=A0AAN8IWA3_PATCE
MDVGYPALYSDISDVEEHRPANDKRIHIANEERILNVANKSIPTNTLTLTLKRRNRWTFNTFQAWSIWRNNHHNDERTITKDLEHMDNCDLNFWLKHFVVEVTNKDGGKYPPNSISSLVMGLMSYLRLKMNLLCLINMTSSGGDMGYRPRDLTYHPLITQSSARYLYYRLWNIKDKTP